MTEFIEAYTTLESGEGGYRDTVRGLLAAPYRSMPDSDIDQLLEQAFSEMTADQIEGFWDTVRNVGATVAPIALPAAGAAVGTLIGGPAGTAIGASVGRAGAQFVSGRPPVAPGGPAQPSPGQAAASTVPPGGNRALNDLIALLSSAEFQKILAAQVFGQMGRQSVQVGPGGADVSFPSIMNALAQLASGASAAAGAPPSVDQTAYLRDSYGSYVADPANPDERAIRVVELLRESRNAAARPQSPESVTAWMAEAGLLR